MSRKPNVPGETTTQTTADQSLDMDAVLGNAQASTAADVQGNTAISAEQQNENTAADDQAAVPQLTPEQIAEYYKLKEQEGKPATTSKAKTKTAEPVPVKVTAQEQKTRDVVGEFGWTKEVIQ